MTIGTLTISGEEYVVIPRREYDKLKQAMNLPPYPPADRRGERPAREALLTAMARSLMRRRLEAGLEQRQLARLAGVRPETISRLESGKYRPRKETMERLDRALAARRGSTKE